MTDLVVIVKDGQAHVFNSFDDGQVDQVAQIRVSEFFSAAQAAVLALGLRSVVGSLTAPSTAVVAQPPVPKANASAGAITAMAYKKAGITRRDPDPYKKPVRRKRRGPTGMDVYEWLCTLPGTFVSADIAERFGLSTKDAGNKITMLKTRGLIRVVRHDQFSRRGGRTGVYEVVRGEQLTLEG